MSTKKSTSKHADAVALEPGSILGNWGVPGLLLRATDKGTKTWVLRYKADGRDSKIKLGRFDPGAASGHMPVEAAKTAANNERKSRDKLGHLGDHRRAERQQTANENAEILRKAEEDSFTLSKLVRRYLDEYASLRKRSWREDQRTLEKDVIRALGANTPVQSIRPADVNTMLVKIARRAPVQANRCLAITRRMFSWAFRLGLVEYNPAQGLERPGGTEKKRDRYLEDSELVQFFRGLAGMELSKGLQDVRHVLELSLRIGARSGEVCSMRWADVNLKDKIWTTYEATADGEIKTDKVYRFRLPNQVRDFLMSRPKDSDYVFPARDRDGTPHEKSEHKKLTPRGLDQGHLSRAVNSAKKFGIEASWRPHDLRGTVSSHLGKLGYSRVIQDLVTQHADGSMAARYDRYDYDKEVRDALTKWNNKLDELRDAKEAQA